MTEHNSDASALDKRYQVFISSTYNDLQPARGEVSKALLQAQCFPAGMELFPAADEEQFSYIRRIIQESDYYVIISAGKYGSIHPESGLSYTEMEYDYAVDLGKPVIRLLHKDPFTRLTGDLIESSAEGRDKLARFREKMCSRSLVNFWESHHELGKCVVLGLLEAQRRFPASGWIRNDIAGDLQSFLMSQLRGIEKNPGITLDALPIPCLRIARDGKIDMSSRQARALLSDPAPHGKSLADLVEGLGRPVAEWIEEAREGRGLNRPEVVRVTRADSVFLQVTLGQIEEDGEVAVMAILNDATELKALEAQFVQSQRMQAIGQLAGGVAHDFNNLLTAISGHCDLLLLRHGEGDSDYADLSQIAQNANRAASLVGQLAAFSGMQVLQLQTLDLRDTLSDLTHLLNRLVGEKITLVLDHDPDLQYVRADKRQLEQVLMNLIVNARDAMPRGGTIEITTRMRRFSEPLHRDRAVVPPGDWVEVMVSDSGTGIPPDKLPKIFEPFFTTKRIGEGTGLGLSTAYGIVKQTGGFIFADSEVGVGTTFSLFLPAHGAPDRPGLAELQEREEPIGRDGGVILLVEDEAPIRAFASRALRMNGYTVLEAENAEEALRLLADLSIRVDLFVTDDILPGLDGPSWVRRALEDRSATQVIFMSSPAPERKLADDMMRIPHSTLLTKPFTLTDLVTRVRAQMMFS